MGPNPRKGQAIGREVDAVGAGGERDVQTAVDVERDRRPESFPANSRPGEVLPV